MPTKDYVYQYMYTMGLHHASKHGPTYAMVPCPRKCTEPIRYNTEDCPICGGNGRYWKCLISPEPEGRQYDKMCEG